MTKKVAIIGAGVNGLSCAMLLLQLGWDVTIYTKHDPEKSTSDPAFSSLYPAASVIPHSVNTPNLAKLFSDSQKYFSDLYHQQFPGLSKHTHFELFGESVPMDLPVYENLMMDFSHWNEFSDDFYPRHPEIPITFGWRFSCFFADWSLYYPSLLQKVIRLGGKVEIQSLSPEDFKNLQFEIIINCSGLGSVELFGDDHKLIHRGHLLHLQNAPSVRNKVGDIISYNFTPGKDYYQSEDGHLQDVYFYPVDKGWVFGGSRQEGIYSKNESWSGEQTIEPKDALNGSSYPAQIYKLNAGILKHTFDIEPADYSNRFLKIGYRYTRSTQDGLRLESEIHANKLIIHNYGHGGSGVTLSWGCALEVVRVLEKTFV